MIKFIRLHFLLFLIAMPAMTISTSSALACASCRSQAGGESTRQTNQTIKIVNEHTTDEFIAHRSWIISVLWEDNILPAMMMMAEELSAVAMKQTEIVGMFFDAEQDQKAKQTLQRIQADIRADYQPTQGMCQFGSAVASLASSERRADFTAIALAQRSIDRQLGKANTVGIDGDLSDKRARLEQYKNRYCDPTDFDSAMGALCGDGASDPSRTNNDIDFSRVFANQSTLDVDYNNNDTTSGEEDLFALAATLYASDLPARMPPGTLEDFDNEATISEEQINYMNLRSIVAKRSVAENSFNALASKRSKGSANSNEMMNTILKEMGIEGSEDTQQMLRGAPSYNVQMDVMNNLIYQNQDFYTNLSGSALEGQRKQVAIQANRLAQLFDTLDSMWRNEMNLAVTVEMELMKMQNVASKVLDETTD